MKRTKAPSPNQNRVDMAFRAYSRFLTTVPMRLQENVNRYRHCTTELPLFRELYESQTSLFLYGPVRTGKTVLSAALCAKIVYTQELTKTIQFATIKFFNVTTLLQQLQESYKNNAFSDVLSMLQMCDLLVLDDLAVSKQTEWAMSVLYSIINFRYENNKTTIFTSNLSVEELATLWGDERIPRRIGDMCEWVNMTTRWNETQTV